MVPLLSEDVSTMDFHGLWGVRNGTDPKNLQTSRLTHSDEAISYKPGYTSIHTHHKQRV